MLLMIRRVMCVSGLHVTTPPCGHPYQGGVQIKKVYSPGGRSRPDQQLGRITYPSLADL